MVSSYPGIHPGEVVFVLEPNIKISDPASVSKSVEYGGIDFNYENLNLQLKNQGGAIDFKIDPAMLNRLRALPGLTPVNIQVRPLSVGEQGVLELKMFLGLQDDKNIPLMAKAG